MKYIYLLLCLCGLSLNAQVASNIQLNSPDAQGGLSIMEALHQRKSASAYSSEKLKIQDLSNLLWAANGINRADVGKKTAPSTMNSQSIDVYVAMEEGVYLYDAANNSLNLVAEGDHRGLAGSQLKAPLPAAILFLVTDLSRFSDRITPEQALQAARIDGGIVSQNISLFCSGMKFATRPRATMDYAKVKEVFKLTDKQHPLVNHPVGYNL